MNIFALQKCQQQAILSYCETWANFKINHMLLSQMKLYPFTLKLKYNVLFQDFQANIWLNWFITRHQKTLENNIFAFITYSIHLNNTFYINRSGREYLIPERARRLEIFEKSITIQNKLKKKKITWGFCGFFVCF